MKEKKTVAFEIFEQLGFKAPDRIFVSVGDGVIISGVYKGFEDLMKLGFIDKMPAIVAVQAEGSDNLVRNLHNNSFEMQPSHTIADSISVDAPRNFYMARQFIKKYNGVGITVGDQGILSAASVLAKETGIFTEPASAAAYAGVLRYYNESSIKPDSTNVVLLTGSGLKDLKAVERVIGAPQSIIPKIENLKMLLGL